jgi:hypothetical protein
MDPVGLFSSFLVLMLVVFVVAVVFAVFRGIARKATIDDLRQNGEWILATVQEIKQKTRTTTTGTPPHQMTHTHHYYVVVGTWTDPATGSNYTFSSDELSRRPRYAAGDDVPVLVAPSNYRRYHIEI